MEQIRKSTASTGTSKARIEIGYRVGQLTVESPTKERKSGYMVWICRCDCGGSVKLDTRCLQRGTVTDCGCVSKVKPGQKDISGQRFGKLTAVQPTGEILNGSVVWRCVCDCGGEVCAPLHQLTAGYRKSCGCLGHPARKDFIGQHFGRLTVIAYAGKRNGLHRWKCRCDCGNETVVGQTLLQTGKTSSCGCLRSESYQDALKLIEGTSITILETGRNKLRSNNTSGHAGVYRRTSTGRWVAQITFKGKRYNLGTYIDKQDAIRARKRGEEMHDDFLEWYYTNRSQKAEEPHSDK